MTSRLFVETSKQSGIYCFDDAESLRTYSTVFMFRSNMKQFNESINIFDRIVAGGLIVKWVNDLRARTAPIRDMPLGEPLKLSQLIGPFSICFPVLACAFVAAIMEQIIFRKARRIRGSRAWKVLEKLIDGQRHYCLLRREKVCCRGQQRSTDGQ